MKSKLLICLLLCSIHASSQELKLFNPEIRKAAEYRQVVVMDFVEHYFQDLFTQKQTTMQTKLADDKVYFRKGKPSDLHQINDTVPFSINLLDRYYEVKWMKGGNPFVTIVFPAQYDLILGMSQEKAQQQMKDAILAAPERKGVRPVPDELKADEEGIYVSKTEKFELESLNDALYYNKVKDSYKPVFDTKHKEYSAANLFQGLIEGANYRMYVEQSVYGLKTVNYSISLSQWLNYCALWNMKVFFAIEEVREDGVLALVIAQSKELGCNHMLSVVIPDKFITDKRAVLKARMTSYIPMHNVKDLYKKESSTRQKVKWQ